MEELTNPGMRETRKISSFKGQYEKNLPCSYYPPTCQKDILCNSPSNMFPRECYQTLGAPDWMGSNSQPRNFYFSLLPQLQFWMEWIDGWLSSPGPFTSLPCSPCTIAGWYGWYGWRLHLWVGCVPSQVPGWSIHGWNILIPPVVSIPGCCPSPVSLI